MAKTHIFICRVPTCGMRFETTNITMPICRFCIQAGHRPENYGVPKASALQKAKWEHGKKQKKLQEKKEL